VNQTSVVWFTEEQPAVETTTNHSKLMAGRTATELIMDMRITIHYLGVPSKRGTYLHGYDKTMVDSSIFPNVCLKNIQFRCYLQTVLDVHNKASAITRHK